MKAHKGNVFGLLFFFYFGIYAVLPLVCTLSSAGAAEIVATNSGIPSFTASFPGFLPKSRRAQIVSGKESPNVTFLMRKESAVLPDDFFTNLLSPAAFFLSGDDLPSSPGRLQCRIYASPDRGERVHHRLYLSHSPPAWQDFGELS
jgi:hypothetical protein